jgi:hypothetical protein
MIGTLIIVLLILATGTRASDALEVRQQEIVLRKLSTPEAHDYYERLRRRAWRARALRGLAVLSLVTLAYAGRRLMLIDPPGSPRAGAGDAAHLTQRT